VGNFIPEAAQGADQNVMGHIGPEVPYVRVVVDRGPAPVKTGLARLNGLEDLQLTPKGVKEAEILTRFCRIILYHTMMKIYANSGKKARARNKSEENHGEEFTTNGTNTYEFVR
jgi:hypothetical protein